MTFRRTAILLAVCAFARVLNADAQSATITGRVVDAQNAGVSAADVSLAGPDRRLIETRTGDEGTFTVPDIQPGRYTLRVSASGFAQWSQTVTATPSMAPLTIVLKVAGLSESISVIGTVPMTLAMPNATGSRLGLTPLETPASVQVISGEVARERGDQTLQEASTRAVGVTRQGDPGNGGNSVIARGFGGVGSVMQLFDGAQMFVGAGTVTFPFDTWTVERIEVLNGPASVLYGNGAIGGAINVVPRKPNPYGREGAVRAAGGSFNTWRGAVDLAGPITDRTAYRFDVSSNRSSGWVRDNDSRNTAVSASVRHEFTPTLNLTMSEDFGYQQPGEYFGAPTIDGVIDRNRRDVNYNVADADIWYRDSFTRARLEWHPTANVQVNSRLHAMASNRHWRNAEEYWFDPSTRLINRDSYIEIRHRQRQIGNRTELVAASRLWGRANTAAAGVDYNYVTFQHTNNSPYGGSSVTDRDNSTPGLFINEAGTVPKYRTHTNHVGVFAEDRLAITSKLSLVGGFRADRYDAERLNLIANTTTNRVYPSTSGRGGVVYELAKGFTTYGQMATATDTLGDIISNNPAASLLDPTHGRQVEVGLKQLLPNRRAQWTLAAYHIVKKKLLTPIPGRPGEVQQVGAQSSRGVEATAGISLPHGVRLDGNIALLDARYDEFFDDTANGLVSRAGNTPPSIPERTINLAATWSAPQQWQFRLGARSVGPRYWDNTNSTRLPTYTVLDAGVKKRLTHDTSVDLFLYNLTDRLYATDFYYNGFAPQWMLGAPRSAEVAVTVGF